MAKKELDLKKELEKMRVKYAKKHLKDIDLPRPEWMKPEDDLNAVFSEKKELLADGRVYYAQVVQANELLFQRQHTKRNCPALFLYTTDSATNAAPYALKLLAHRLFSYKDKDLSTVPEEWREAARIITDEYDRSQLSLTLRGENGPVEVFFVTAMVFRQYIPKQTILGSIIPILAVPGKCKSVLPLPEKYWSRDFKKAWVNGEV